MLLVDIGPGQEAFLRTRVGSQDHLPQHQLTQLLVNMGNNVTVERITYSWNSLASIRVHDAVQVTDMLCGTRARRKEKDDVVDFVIGFAQVKGLEKNNDPKKTRRAAQGKEGC